MLMIRRTECIGVKKGGKEQRKIGRGKRMRKGKTIHTNNIHAGRIKKKDQ